MKEIKIKVKYQIGEKLESSEKIYTVVGYEYVKGRIRYIILNALDTRVEWMYLCDFEIDAFLSK